MYDRISVNPNGIENINDHYLSIRISPDGFSFSLIRSKDKTVITGRNNPLKTKDENTIVRRFNEWVQSEEILKIPYPRVEIVYFTDRFTFIPRPFFRPDKSDLIFRRLFHLTSPVKIITSELESSGYYFQFAIPGMLYDKITRWFEGTSLAHPVKLIADDNEYISQGDRLILFFTTGSFYVMLYKEQHLRIANSFAFIHPNDVIFYVLHLLRQEKLHSAETQLILTGNPLLTEKILPHLTQHFQMAEIHTMNAGILFDKDCDFRPDYPLYSIFTEET